MVKIFCFWVLIQNISLGLVGGMIACNLMGIGGSNGMTAISPSSKMSLVTAICDDNVELLELGVLCLIFMSEFLLHRGSIL